MKPMIIRPGHQKGEILAGINSVDGHPALSTSTLMADNLPEMFLLSASLLPDLDMQFVE